MKYCCPTPKSRQRKKQKRLQIGLALVLVGLIVLLIYMDGFVRAVIEGYPIHTATGIMLNLMDEAMQQVLKDGAFDSGKVDNVIYASDGSVVSVEVDTVAVTGVKTGFVFALQKILQDYGNTIAVSVPIGTLIGNEYTIGRGPEVHFKMRYATKVQTDLNSSFFNSGINNSLHKISLKVTNTVFILIPWGQCSKAVTTEYILSETAIVGKVPEAYTNVFDEERDTVGDIFDYGAEVQ